MHKVKVHYWCKRDTYVQQCVDEDLRFCYEPLLSRYESQTDHCNKIFAIIVTLDGYYGDPWIRVGSFLLKTNRSEHHVGT